MDSDFNTSEQLGIDAVDRAVTLAEEYCNYKQQHIQLTNQPRIEALRAEIAINADEVNDLEARIRAAGKPGDARVRRSKLAYYMTITLILVIASFFFSIIAFDPFRLGWKGWLYCLGIAAVTPFCVEKFLEQWDCTHLSKATATVAFAAALSSLVLLAVIRGDVLTHEVQAQQTSVVEIDSDNSVPAEPQNAFYQDTLVLLRVTMALLAVSMELGAGIALHDALMLGHGSGEDRDELRQKLQETKQRIAQLFGEMTELLNGPERYVAHFWSNFYRAMLTHTMRRAITRLFLLLLLLPIISHAQVPIPKHLNLVVELDLSSSVSVKGHDDKSEFEKNVTAITRLLSQVPSDAQVTVLGITENSFSQPYVLLSAKTMDDAGYFGEKLTIARQQIVHAWHERSARLQPDAPGTDILGSLVVAGQLLKQGTDAQRKVLVLFSDMRESTRHLNFEAHSDIPLDLALSKVREGRLLPDLKGVDVYVLGADAAGQDVAQWDRVREFWTAYFQKVGANLRDYSIMRPMPDL